MPRSGGIFTLVPGYFAVDGTTIAVSQHNPPLEDIADALTDSLPRDGSAPMVGNLPMGGFKLTGLAAGTNPNDSLRFSQLGAFQNSVSALSLAADEMVYANGVNTAAKTALTSFARTILDDVDGAAVRTTIGAQASSANLTELAAPTYVRGDLIRRGAAGLERLALGSSGQVLLSNGTDAAWGSVAGWEPVESGVLSLSGSSTNIFIGMPSGVKRINVYIRNASLDAGAAMAGLQLRTGGTFVTTGYDSVSGNRSGETASTSRIMDRGSNNLAATVWDVTYRLRRTTTSTNVWQADHNGTIQGSAPFYGYGTVTLTTEIDGIRYQGASANFDGGSVFAEYFLY